MKPTLDLRNLTEQVRRAAINEAVAVHCAEYIPKTYHPCPQFRAKGHQPITVFKLGGIQRQLPPFATSADAVLPLLEKYGDVDITMTKHAGTIRYVVTINRDEETRAVAKTLPEAACLARLRATGVEVLT